jgi:hypothetical protein
MVLSKYSRRSVQPRNSSSVGRKVIIRDVGKGGLTNGLLRSSLYFPSTQKLTIMRHRNNYFTPYTGCNLLVVASGNRSYHANRNLNQPLLQFAPGNASSYVPHMPSKSGWNGKPDL